MEDNQHDPARPWTPGPWQDDPGDEEFQGVYALHRPLTSVIEADRAAHECRPADLALIALAPEMAEAILAWHDDPRGHADMEHRARFEAVADKLRALTADQEPN